MFSYGTQCLEVSGPELSQPNRDLTSLSPQIFWASSFCPHAFLSVVTSECSISSTASIFQAGRGEGQRGKRLKSQSCHVFPLFKGLIQKHHLATSPYISLSGLYHSSAPDCCSRQSEGSVRKKERVNIGQVPTSVCWGTHSTSWLICPPPRSSLIHCTQWPDQSSRNLAPNSSYYFSSANFIEV